MMEQTDSPVAEAPNPLRSPELRGPEPDTNPADDLPVTVIERKPGWQFVDVGELWRHRELLYFLVWRDVKVRYKQTVLGIGWSVLQPLATMVVFSVFLGPMSGLSASVDHHPLFVFAGVLPWTFFANAVSGAGISVVANQNLVSKIFFPRLIMPFGTVGACLVDFFIAFALLVGMMAWYGVVPGWQLAFLPLVLALLVLAAAGVGTFLAGLITAHRDFRFILGFGVQLWMFATPTIYLTTDAVGPLGRTILPLNPAYGLILNFRQTLLGGPIDWYALGVSAAVSLGLMATGCAYFRRVESSFADII
jgi:lipopolysaccharide transport system permease protein